MSFVNKDNYISSFTVCTPFISFFYLIALAKTSDIMMRGSGEMENPWLFLILAEKLKSFSPQKL
jgi:hypothetical protein